MILWTKTAININLKKKRPSIVDTKTFHRKNVHDLIFIHEKKKEKRFWNEKLIILEELRSLNINRRGYYLIVVYVDAIDWWPRSVGRAGRRIYTYIDINAGDVFVSVQPRHVMSSLASCNLIYLSRFASKLHTRRLSTKR